MDGQDEVRARAPAPVPDDTQDEVRARALLVEMQERVIRGPYAALGIEQRATAADIRHAFLELTKKYHPARFGRMSTEIQRLSNEVFLSLRAAHDTLAKPKVRATGPILPSTTPASAGKQQTGPLPLLRPPTPPRPVATQPTPATPPVRPPSNPNPSRPPTGPTPSIASSAPGTQRQPIQAVRPSAPPPNRMPSPSPPPDDRGRTTPAGGLRIGTPASAKPSAARSGAYPVADPELAAVYDLMQRGQWNEARGVITALSAKAPTSPKYRALLCYTRGREAQLAGARDEARVELDSALQLDPDLQLAKTALAELFTRRK